MLQDLRYAVRTFAANPGFTAVAVLSLAIGIGANTAIFSVTNALLLRPLPYKDADRLTILWNRSPGLNIAEDWFSTAQYFDIKNGHRGFEQLAIAIGGNSNLTGGGEPERVGTIRVSSNLLPMLGARPALGRLFVAEEDAPGRAGAAVLSHGLWARRFGSDPRILGKTLTLNGLPYEVAGVLPQSFSLPREVLPTLGGAEQAEILLPLPLTGAAPRFRGREDYNIMGKLRPGVTLAQAQAEMETITARLRRDFPEVYPPNGGLTFSIVPLQEQVAGGVRRTLFVLLGAVCFLLLIACANVANLLLSRAVSRQKEIAVRTAVGASRSRLVRQLLTESVLLSVFGGALALLLSLWAVRWIRVLGPASVPRVADIAVDARVLVFTLLISLVTAVLFGLAPALRIARIDLNAALKDAARGSAGAGALWSHGNRLRRLLAIAQLGLSVMLLTGAGLLVRSFARLQQVEPGFNARDPLTFGLTMTGRKYNEPPAVLEAYRQLWERLESTPGVAAAGGISALPLSQMPAWTPISIEGRTPPPGERFLNADERVVSGHYFQAMQIPLRAGRFFDESDTRDKPLVVIVDERLALEYWPGQDPIGKRLRHGGVNSTEPWMTVVGVVGRVKHESLDDADPRIAIHLAHTQFPGRALTVAVRGRMAPAALAASARAAVRAIDRDMPVYQVRTMAERVDESLARRRFSMLLLGAFAALALALAAIGVYGVMAYLVSQGRRDIGIRLALGATESRVLAMIVRQGMALALAGAALGLAGAFALTRFMGSMLFGITATDPLTFTAVPAALAAVALLATSVPARRAARIDPMSSLRCE